MTIEYLRSFKIFGYAIFDLVLAFGFMILISPLLSKLFLKIGVRIPKRSWIYLTIPLSILIHILVGNITPMTANFLDINGYYILKIVVIIMLVLGLKDIRLVKNKKVKMK